MEGTNKSISVDEDRNLGAAVIKKTPQTKIFVANTPDAEALFNAVFVNYDQTITGLLEQGTGKKDMHFPIDTDAGHYITEECMHGKCILMCTTSPIGIFSVDKEKDSDIDIKEDFMVGKMLGGFNTTTKKYRELKTGDDHLEDGEVYAYIQCMYINNWMVQQVWNTGEIGCIVFNDFMDKMVDGFTLMPMDR